MMNMNRRDLCVALSSLAALAAAAPAGGQASSDEPVLSVPRSYRFDELPVKAQAKCRLRVERLRDLGHELRRPEADLLRDGIYELRASLQGVLYRVLYFLPRHGHRDCDPRNCERGCRSAEGNRPRPGA